MAYKITIRELQENHDVPALQHILRLSVDPQRRVEAARALGELMSLDATQGLMRAFQEDEDEAVRKAARQALDELLGTRADEAIAVYEQGEEDEDEDEDGSEEEEDPLEGIDPDEKDEFEAQADELPRPKWEPEHMHALVTLAKASPDAEIRFKAVQELAKLDNTTALNTLFAIALWSSERKERDAANQSLMEIYGDDYPRMLESHRANQQAMEEWEFEDEDILSGEEYADVGEDEDEEGDDEVEEDSVEMEAPASSAYAYTGTPVMQEERSGTLGRVLIYVAVIVITVVLLGLLFR